MGCPAEDRFGEGRERDLLPEKGLVVLEQPALRQVVLQHVVGDQVAPVEGEEQVPQPGVLRLEQRVEDRVQEQFAEVVDRVGDEGGDAEVVGARPGFRGRERFEVDAGEVEERVAVVGGEVVLDLGFGVSRCPCVGLDLAKMCT